MAQSMLVSELYKQDTNKNQEEDSDYYVDGVRVTHHCHTFCNALRSDRAFRYCKFGSQMGSGTRVEVFVYFPDEIYCRGVIGYRDIGITATLHKYFIESEFIVNNKVKYDKRQHNMLGSDDVHKAVKVAKKHLRKYDINKIVSITAYKLTAAMSAEKESKTDAEADAMKGLSAMLTRSGALTAELVNMVKTDYAFKDDQVKEAIVHYMNTIDGDIEVSSRNIAIALVLVHPPGVGESEHTITVKRGMNHLNLRKRVYTGDVMTTLREAEVETYTQYTLPDDIRQKISALNILDGNSYVDGLGVRQSENVYYIAEDV